MNKSQFNRTILFPACCPWYVAISRRGCVSYHPKPTARHLRPARWVDVKVSFEVDLQFKLKVDLHVPSVTFTASQSPEYDSEGVVSGISMIVCVRPCPLPSAGARGSRLTNVVSNAQSAQFFPFPALHFSTLPCYTRADAFVTPHKEQFYVCCRSLNASCREALACWLVCRPVHA